MLKPVFTEKSLKLAKQGKYSFWVEKDSGKPTIKSEIAAMFGVHVTGIKTINGHNESRRSAKGQKFTTKSNKKAIVTIKDGEKIDVFEESKK
jgi:large subunit ribosomal protein L23